MTNPRLSICIPTWNGERELARLLPALARQEVAGGTELVAIDSGSTDDTCGLLARAGVRFERIPHADFGHGRTRNALARLARADLVVFLSQDAEPRDDDALALLAAALDDPWTAGAFARVLPRSDDDPLTARSVLEHVDASPLPWVGDPGTSGARFNDVASCVRRSTLLEIPFPDVPFGEDVAWARAVIAAGWRVRYEPRAVVLHAHRYTPREAYARYRIDAQFQREHHGVRLRPSWWSVARGIGYELSRDVQYVRRHGGWAHLLRAPALRTAQVLGQRAGSRG